MKRFAITLFFLVVTAATFWQLLFREKFDLLQFFQNLVKQEEPHPQRKINRAPRPQQVQDTAAVRIRYNSGVPAWRGQGEKERRLEPLLVIGPKLTTHQFSFRRIIDLDFDRRGNLFVLDAGNKTIEGFRRDGTHVQTIGVGEKRSRFMSKPTDMFIAADDRFYIADRRKGVIIFENASARPRILSIDYQATQIVVDRQGYFTVLTPKDDYLLHRYEPDGAERIAFARQAGQEAAIRAVMSLAKLAVDANGDIFVSFLHPYRIIKYSKDGHPQLRFDRELPEPVNPPTVKRDNAGKVTRIFRQKVTYDLKYANGLLFNLINDGKSYAGDTLDLFDDGGTYVLSYYLAEPAELFALSEDKLAIVVPGRQPQIRLYSIEEIAP